MPRIPAPTRVRLKSATMWAELNRLGWSQHRLADALGVSSPFVSYLLSGCRSPSVRVQERLLELFPTLEFDDLFNLAASAQSRGSLGRFRYERTRPRFDPKAAAGEQTTSEARGELLPGAKPLPQDFGDRLKKLKERLGLTWPEMAARLGTDARQLRRWRRGVEPTGRLLLALIKLAMSIPDGVELILPDFTTARNDDRRQPA